MLGAIIGGAVGALGGLFGSASNNQRIKEQMRLIAERKREAGALHDEQLARNEDWYNRRYNEDATQRADAQRLISMTEESIKKRNKAAAAKAAVVGGTDESVAAEKEQNNQALADAVSRIAASADSRKDAIEQQYMQKKDAYDEQYQRRKDALDDALAGLQGQKKNGYDIAGSLIGGAGSGLSSLLG